MPTEHGGWGFTLEPILLGLLVAPSFAGLGLGVAAFASFLVRHPLRLLAGDLGRRRRYPRTFLAMRLVAVIGLAGLAGLAAGISWSAGPFWWAIAAALPFAAAQVWFDVAGSGRSTLVQVSGAIAIGAAAPAVALAGGASTEVAVGLWIVVAARAVASIAHARAMVLRGRGEHPSPLPVLALEAAVAAVAGGAAIAGLVPWPSVAALSLLLALTAVSFMRAPTPAKVVGITQMAFGLLLVLVTAGAIRLGGS